MIYHFSGQERLTLFFDTPNQCGAALGMLASACCAVVLGSRRVGGHRPSHQRAITVLATVGAVALFIGIALTYSRGAFVATLVALGGLATIAPGSCWRAGWLALGLFAVALIVPAGFERLKAAQEVSVDASISHRLALWQGAFAMGWDFFSRGIGFDRFLETYSAWYEPLDRFERYATGVSDYATSAACGGIPMLACCLGPILGVLGMGAVAALRNGSVVLRMALAAATCYLVAAVFSTFLFTPVLTIAFGISVVVVAVETVRSLRPTWPTFVKLGAWLLGGSLAAGVAFAAIGFSCAQTFATRPVSPATIGLVDPSQREIKVLSPRHGASVGTIIVLAERSNPERDGRRLLRPLCSSGFEVVLFTPTDFAERGIDECRQLIANLRQRERAPRRLFAVGLGQGARLALLLGLESSPHRLSGVVAIAGIYWHPTPSLSPLDNLTRLRAPVLAFADPRDKLHNPSETTRFVAAAARAGVAAEFVSADLGSEKPIPFWQALERPLLSFLQSPVKS